MNRNLCLAAFVAGLLALLWIGAGYVTGNPLALTMTLIIGAIYLMGTQEMRRFSAATASLDAALSAIPASLGKLGDWLDTVPPTLQNTVRLRVEGERSALPGPALTPYLTGLLVMLGMLGTFLGMVVTLNGAVFALQGSTDLEAMRAALSAPIRGLGLAFGTSVAGVACSAMLGFISALCRRERQQVGQRLDAKIATDLHVFSLAHQRQETFRALQTQAQSLPEVVTTLQQMMAAMERQNQQLHERMVSNQEGFHRDVKAVYTGLAVSVDASLKSSLSESARAANATLQPMVESTLQGIARETATLRTTLADTVTQQLDGLSERFGETVSRVESSWSSALDRHNQNSDALAGKLQQSLSAFAESFEQRSAALVSSLQADLARRDAERQAALGAALEAMAATLQREWQQAGTQTLAQQQQICATMERTSRDIAAQAEAHASKTLDEIGQLMATAAAAPRAAAEVIGQLRQELTQSVARDNALLEERGRIMETLNVLLDAIQHSAAEQRAAIDALVASSTALLERTGSTLGQQIEAGSARMADSATQVSGSAVEMASLGEAFGNAVQQFGEANEKTIASLQRIEAALDKSMARSDEQLAYYVAQAREIIDLSLLSQKQIVDELQQLAGKKA